MWQRGVCDEGVCVVKGRHAWQRGACKAEGGQERWSLQRTIRNLLECILVWGYFQIDFRHLPETILSRNI